MRTALRALCLSTLLTALIPAFSAAAPSSGFNAFLAAGTNFTFPNAVRAGNGAWEGGLLSAGFIGANKNFPIGPHTYSGFGLGVNVDGFPSSLGFQASAGFNYELFWNIGLRGEMMARAVLNGSTLAYGLLGVSYGF